MPKGGAKTNPNTAMLEQIERRLSELERAVFPLSHPNPSLLHVLPRSSPFDLDYVPSITTDHTPKDQ